MFWLDMIDMITRQWINADDRSLLSSGTSDLGAGLKTGEWISMDVSSRFLLRQFLEFKDLKEYLSRYTKLKISFRIKVYVSCLISPLKLSHFLEFVNCVSEVSRLQYEWSSDCWSSDAFGNHWGKCVSSLKKVFSFLWRSVFVQLAPSISIRRNRIRALFSRPRLALRAEKFRRK
jgi:hypothetical protein